MKLTLAPLPFALLLSLIGCGSETPARGSEPASVAGTYDGRWVLQVHRLSDDYRKGFICGGRLLLAEHPPSGGVLSFFGSATSTNCAAGPYAFAGTVAGEAFASFEAQAPPPPEGPCPGASPRFQGRMRGSTVEATGQALVDCPPYGLHEIVYELSFTR